MTLAVSYVMGIYGVVQRLGVLSAGFFHQASDTAEPLSVLAPHFPDGELKDLDPYVMGLHRSLVELYEGLKRYPVLYYYHSRRASRSLHYTFRMIGGVAGALCWGLPKNHPASQSPWLPTLITGVDMMTSYIDERFLSESLEETPEPVPFETFEAAFERGKEPSDPWLERFFEMQLYMWDLVRTQDSLDPEECYGRYKEWLPFAPRNWSFYEATARELG